MVFRCVAEQYDPQGQTYTVDEFNFMCAVCFGVLGAMRQYADGRWVDANGVVTLVPV